MLHILKADSPDVHGATMLLLKLLRGGECLLETFPIHEPLNVIRLIPGTNHYHVRGADNKENVLAGAIRRSSGRFAAFLRCSLGSSVASLLNVSGGIYARTT